MDLGCQNQILKVWIFGRFQPLNLPLFWPRCINFSNKKLDRFQFLPSNLNFNSKNFFIIVWRNSIFQPSEAPRSTVLQNWKKLPSFHQQVPKGQLNFWWLALNLFWHNYSNNRHLNNYHEGISIYGYFESSSNNI